MVNEHKQLNTTQKNGSFKSSLAPGLGLRDEETTDISGYFKSHYINKSYDPTDALITRAEGSES